MAFDFLLAFELDAALIAVQVAQVVVGLLVIVQSRCRRILLGADGTGEDAAHDVVVVDVTIHLSDGLVDLEALEC